MTTLEAEQARGASEQTRAQLPALQTSIAQTRHAIAVLCGERPAALAVLLDAPGPVPQAAADLALSLPAETLRQRPDVRAAELQVAAALARVAQADAARLPSFRLGGSLGLSALAMGGLVGIVIATGASIGLAAVMQVPCLFDPAINLLSFVFSAGIGVLFGYFPVRRAAPRRADGPDRGSTAPGAQRLGIHTLGTVQNKPVGCPRIHNLRLFDERCDGANRQWKARYRELVR